MKTKTVLDSLKLVLEENDKPAVKAITRVQKKLSDDMDYGQIATVLKGFRDSPYLKVIARKISMEFQNTDPSFDGDSFYHAIFD